MYLFLFNFQSMHWAAPKKETMLEGIDGSANTYETQTEPQYVTMKGPHEPGDLGFLRTGMTLCNVMIIHI